MAELVVYFKKPADWTDTVRIHYWNTRPGGHETTWPGVPMTEEAEGWFVYRFGAIEAASLVFNDGYGHQTGDLYRDHSGFYTEGRWYSGQPEVLKASLLANDFDQSELVGASLLANTVAAPVPAEIEPTDSRTDFREETIYFLITT